MKITKYIIGLSMMAGTVLGLPSCTDLFNILLIQVHGIS
jgi:starch-binding outer membrane protein, SusD/RagB family